MARGAFTLKARAATHAPGLGGRVHDPDTLPSYRLPRARGPGTSRVPEPAPLRVRSRRGYRVRLEPRGISVEEKPSRPAHRCRMLSAPPRASTAWEECFLHARSRVSEVRLIAPAGVATGDASDQRLHSETIPTRALVLRRFPARRSGPVRRLSAPPGDRPLPETLRLRARSRECLFLRAASPVRRRALRAPGSSGPPDANEAGENRGSRRDSHFGDRGVLRRGSVFFLLARPHRPPLMSLSPPPSRVRGLEFHRAPSAGLEAAKTGSAGAS